MMKVSIKKHIVVLSLYIVLAAVMTLPIIGHFSSRLAGEGGDPWQTLWRFEYKQQEISQAIGDSRIGSYLAEEFLGRSNPRLVNLSVWPWMPLHLMFGEPFAYNVVWLLSFILSGYSMYLLVAFLLRPSSAFSVFGFQFSNVELAAFIAGVVYMFLPFHVAHAYGHFGAMQTQWLPFIILTFLAFWKKPSFLRVALLGFLLVIQAWTEHHYLVWLGIFLLIWLFMNWRRVLQRIRRFPVLNAQLPSRILGGSLILLILVFLALSLSPTVRLALQSDSSLDLGREQLVRFSSDVFSFVVPAPFHPVWGGLSNNLFASSFTGNVTEATEFLGLVPLLIVVFFYRHIPARPRRFWTFVILVFFFIALGPQLHLFGRVTGIALPYEIVDSWPGFSAVRAVGRAGVFVGISMCVLLGFVLSRQLKRLSMAGVLLVVVLIELLFLPMPTQSTELSEVYGAVRDLPGTAILEIPTATNYTAASRSLYASLLHGKNVFGNIALERAQDPEVLRLSRSVPTVRQLLFVRTADLREERFDFFAQDLAETLPDALQWLGVGGVVIHKDSLSDLQTASLERFLVEDVGLSAEFFDDVTLYSGDLREVGARQGSDGVFLMRDSGWENVGFDADRGHTFAEVVDRARVTVVNVNTDPVVVTLRFDVPAESEGRAVVTEAGEFVGQVESTSVIIERTLTPGEHEFLFEVTSDEKVIIQDPVLGVAL